MTVSSKHFLILDDEESIRQSIAAYMEDDGYIVFQAASGEQALEIVKNNHIDEAVVDIRLPGIDGNTFMIEARKILPDIK
ncbi:MAG: response regulator, partial [Desulfobacula sp.]|nr:response regulator [Desulfobacula sp.]